MITASAAAVMVVVVAVIVVMVMVMLMAVVVMVVMVMLSPVMADLVLSVMADLIGHLHPRRFVDEPFGSMLVAVEDHVLYALEKLRFDLVIDLEHGWIYDRHVKTGLELESVQAGLDSVSYTHLALQTN